MKTKRRRTKKVTDGFIYVIGNRSWPDYFKVGRSKDIYARSRQISNQRPFDGPCEIIDAVFSKELLAADRLIKARLLPYRYGGEFYRCPIEKIVAEIRALRSCLK
ncbi:MAG: GIY-YIG nuclease family protein [Sphingobacteriales bacterium]|nr:MAG: GIY-YIG nuclease family protein [Sphingobacteriales bacterium]